MPLPLDLIEDLGVQPDAVFRHAAVSTADAQVKALQEQGCSCSSRVAKNLFLKDKRNRFYLCTALHDTDIPFEKALGLRLGLKKGELRFADGNAMREVLGVGPGSATPLAACGAEAARVTVLLDTRLRDAPFVVHPNDNTQSVIVSASDIDAFFTRHGKAFHWVDLAKTEVKIDRENPPDLKEVAALVPEEKAQGESKGVAAGTDSKKEKKAAREAAKQGGATAQGTGRLETHQVDSVSACVDCLLQLVKKEVEGAAKQTQCLSEAQQQALAAEMTLEVNALRNAAYARGMASAKVSAAAMILGEWA